LEQDHDHAKQIAAALCKKEFTGTILPVETNIVIFEVKDKYNPVSFVARMKEENILCYAISPTQVRIVVHLDTNAAMIQKTIETIQQL
jgi:threonine aldolase